MDDAKVGVYRKFDIRRTDGSSEAGGKHSGCAYFVLDLRHDKFAGVALVAYANACAAEFPALARDLRATAMDSDPNLGLAERMDENTPRGDAP